MDSALNIFIVIVVVLVLWYLVALLRFNAQAIFNFVNRNRFSVYVRPHSAVIGPKNAKVQMTVFLDPACINSKCTYSLLEPMINKYEGKLNVAIRYFPKYTNSLKAMYLLEATKSQNRYAEAREIVFKTPSLWGDGHKSQLDLLYVELEKIGVNIEALTTAGECPKIRSNVVQDITDGHTLAVKNSGEFFVNGHHVGSDGNYFLEDLIKKEIELAYK